MMNGKCAKRRKFICENSSSSCCCCSCCSCNTNNNNKATTSRESPACLMEPLTTHTSSMIQLSTTSLRKNGSTLSFACICGRETCSNETTINELHGSGGASSIMRCPSCLHPNCKASSSNSIVKRSDATAQQTTAACTAVECCAASTSAAAAGKTNMRGLLAQKAEYSNMLVKDYFDKYMKEKQERIRKKQQPQAQITPGKIGMKPRTVVETAKPAAAALPRRYATVQATKFASATKKADASRCDDDDDDDDDTPFDEHDIFFPDVPSFLLDVARIEEEQRQQQQQAKKVSCRCKSAICCQNGGESSKCPARIGYCNLQRANNETLQSNKATRSSELQNDCMPRHKPVVTAVRPLLTQPDILIKSRSNLSLSEATRDSLCAQQDEQDEQEKPIHFNGYHTCNKPSNGNKNWKKFPWPEEFRSTNLASHFSTKEPPALLDCHAFQQCYKVSAAALGKVSEESQLSCECPKSSTFCNEDSSNSSTDFYMQTNSCFQEESDQTTSMPKLSTNDAMDNNFTSLRLPNPNCNCVNDKRKTSETEIFNILSKFNSSPKCPKAMAAEPISLSDGYLPRTKEQRRHSSLSTPYSMQSLVKTSSEQCPEKCCTSPSIKIEFKVMPQPSEKVEFKSNDCMACKAGMHAKCRKCCKAHKTAAACCSTSAALMRSNFYLLDENGRTQNNVNRAVYIGERNGQIRAVPSCLKAINKKTSCCCPSSKPNSCNKPSRSNSFNTPSKSNSCNTPSKLTSSRSSCTVIMPCLSQLTSYFREVDDEKKLETASSQLDDDQAANKQEEEDTVPLALSLSSLYLASFLSGMNITPKSSKHKLNDSVWPLKAKSCAKPCSCNSSKIKFPPHFYSFWHNKWKACVPKRKPQIPSCQCQCPLKRSQLWCALDEQSSKPYRD